MPVIISSRDKPGLTSISCWGTAAASPDRPSEKKISPNTTPNTVQTNSFTRDNMISFPPMRPTSVALDMWVIPAMTEMKIIGPMVMESAFMNIRSADPASVTLICSSASALTVSFNRMPQTIPSTIPITVLRKSLDADLWIRMETRFFPFFREYPTSSRCAFSMARP